ncbi:hypothetical protein ACOME3_006812 [Neoechinorhynchus agilis]
MRRSTQRTDLGNILEQQANRNSTISREEIVDACFSTKPEFKSRSISKYIKKSKAFLIYDNCFVDMLTISVDSFAKNLIADACRLERRDTGKEVLSPEAVFAAARSYESGEECQSLS